MVEPSAKPDLDQTAVLRCLGGLAPFLPFSQAERAVLAQYSRLVSYTKGTTIIREGDPSNNRVYFILEGGVSVYVSGKFILSLDKPGDIFGEMSLVSDEPRSATVKTIQETRLLVVTSAFQERDDPLQTWRMKYFFTRMFANIMADKLRVTSDRAKMYEDALLQTHQAEARSSGLEEAVAHNLRQIRLYSFLVDSAQDAILIASLEGRVERANPALLKEFAIAPESVKGQPLSGLLALPAGQGWPGVMERAQSGGWQGEVAAGQAQVAADCSIFQVRDSDGKAIALAVVLHNISERKAYEARILAHQQALAKANEELKAADRLKDQFVTLVSHELRTPITSILGFVEMLTMPGMVDDNQRDEFLGLVFNDAQRLADLVDKVMAITKLESGQMHLEFLPGFLEETARDLVESLRKSPLAEGKELALVVNGPIVETHFDDRQVRQVLRQLLVNALKFTPGGLVRVTLSQNHHSSHITVEDNGEGIEPAKARRLFSKFDQMASTRDKKQGLGLGLPLSRLILLAHGGDIELSSQPGQGTQVHFWLPHQPPPQDEAVFDEPV